MARSDDIRESFLGSFGQLRDEIVRRESPWRTQLRERAIERFSEVGLPGPKDEDWKYTSVGPLARIKPQPVLARPSVDVDAIRARVTVLPGVDAESAVYVFVDGFFFPECSRPLAQTPGVMIESLAGRVTSDGAALAPVLGQVAQTDALHGFVALNAAFSLDGAIVQVGDDAEIERAVHLVFLASARERAAANHPRNVILLGTNARATVVEHYAGAAGSTHLTNAVTEVVLGRGAALRHVNVQDEPTTAFHVRRIQVRQERDSRLESHAVALGAGLSRTELTTVLGGEGAACDLYGLYVVSGTQHVDHHTTIDHAVAHTTSREVYKGVLADRARGVFTGKVYVRPDAQQISAEQTNKNLLVGAGAIAESRPQLEIYADDVKCTHGAAVGQLDEDALFYLRQRGLDEAAARSLLTYGFVSEVLAALPLERLREALEQRVIAGLGAERIVAETPAVREERR